MELDEPFITLSPGQGKNAQHVVCMETKDKYLWE